MGASDEVSAGPVAAAVVTGPTVVGLAAVVGFVGMVVGVVVVVVVVEVVVVVLGTVVVVVVVGGGIVVVTGKAHETY